MIGKAFRVLLLLPAAWWLYQIFVSGDVGADPAKAFNHKTGEIALYYLLGNLGLGAAVGFGAKFPAVLRFLLPARRFLGVITFLYLIAHVFLYFALEGFEVQALTQLYTKLYLTFAISAWLMLFTLALTSNNFSVRKLGGKNWKRLHRIVYVASFLIMGHVLLIEKSDVVWYGSFFAGLWVVQGIRAGRAAVKRFRGQ